MRVLSAAAVLLLCLGAQGGWARDLAQAPDGTASNGAPAAEGLKVGYWASDAFPLTFSQPEGSETRVGALQGLLPVRGLLP